MKRALGLALLLAMFGTGFASGRISAPEAEPEVEYIPYVPEEEPASIADEFLAENPQNEDGTFPDGTWRVGEDIKPGTYRTANASGSCYWARLRSFDGGDVISNGNPGGPEIVTIHESDEGFQSNRCEEWAPVD